ncbi:MAG: BamA/TamA family outer membrane protein [Bacteroidota bacterium]|nr:BamA/TamA family outer membrane protein [Bacteroidota bacterium]
MGTFVRMYMTKLKYCLLILAVAPLAVSSCSSTKVLADGEYRLASTKVKTEGDLSVGDTKVESYIRQKAGWNPMVYVYNLSTKSGRGLWSKTMRKIGSAPVVYNEDLVGLSVENMERHLEYLGYYDSKVVPEIDINGRIVKVTYKIIPGKRIVINKIKYELPSRGEFAEDFGKDSLNITVRKGDYLSEAALEKESARSAAFFRKIGYYGFNKNYYFFEADTIGKAGKADLTMRINEYTRNEAPSSAKPLVKYHFGEVNIFHPESFKIREKVLRNLNKIVPGEPYNEDIVNSTYTRLSSLNVLSTVNVELSGNEDNTVDCNISISPAKMRGIKLNLEGSSNAIGLLGISPELSFFNRNLFHGGEQLNLGFMGNFQFKPGSDIRSTEFGVSAGIIFPKFLLLPDRLFKGIIPKTEINASFNYQDRPEYRRSILSTSFGYIGSRGKLYYQLYPVQLSIVQISDMTEEFRSKLMTNPFMYYSYEEHSNLGLGGTLYYTTDASVNPQHSYFYTRLQFSTSGNLLSAFKPWLNTDSEGRGLVLGNPYAQYVRGELTLGRTWKFGKNDSFGIATRLLAGAGYAYGNSSALPFEQHFYSGGANSLRGWQARNVGPGLATADVNSMFVIPSQTGDMKLEANIEYRFPVVWKLAGALFIDAGNIWSISNYTENKLALFRIKDFHKAIAADWGLGVRVDLNFILLRVDMGFVTRDPSRPEGHRWCGPKRWIKDGMHAIHFGVGYPF